MDSESNFGYIRKEVCFMCKECGNETKKLMIDNDHKIVCPDCYEKRGYGSPPKCTWCTSTNENVSYFHWPLCFNCKTELKGNRNFISDRYCYSTDYCKNCK